MGGSAFSIADSSSLRLFMAVLLLASADARPEEERRVLRPILEKGDTWTYRTTRTVSRVGKNIEWETITVTFVDDAADTIHTDVDRRSAGASENPDPELKSIYTLEWNWKLLSRPGFGKGTTNRPHSGFFRFPLKVGDWFEHSFESNGATKEGPGPVRIFRQTARVTGWEKISVPAGTFTAIVVQVNATVLLTESGRRYPADYKFWYSPDVRRWVKYNANWPDYLEGELISFKLREN